MLKTKDFYYNLPEELIAQHPCDKRENSRMMVLNKVTGEIEHDHFYNIKKYIKPTDTLVLNDTRVIPARIFGHRAEKEEKIEILLLNHKDDTWETLVKPGKKAKIGTEIIFSDELKGEVVDISEDGSRFIKFKYEGVFEEILDRLGEMPLPPYIKEKLEDSERYQTVYSKHKGSAAAPTAGLHFTKEILKELEDMGVNIVYLTLHVGLGTFRPVKESNILDHKMHSEYFEISEEACEKINNAKKSGGRIISVGTTSTRVLETVADEEGFVHPTKGWTDIYIYPGFKFKCVDALITNFHLPESTLLMLVSALSSREIILKAYEEAVKEKYRFFSFGDCMFIS